MKIEFNMRLFNDPKQPIINDGDSEYMPGDIFVTNSTSSWGVAGHAGIYISNSQILHIAGRGNTPKLISTSYWQTRYTNADTKTHNNWTKVYRCNNASAGQAAANWAYTKYYNSDATYKITHDLSTTNEIYCSKLIWQAYRYGAGVNYVINRNIKRFISPYSLVDEISNTYLFVNFH